MNIKAFCFNPFYENTYILSNAQKEAWIIDPGCFDRDEQIEIETYLEDSNFCLLYTSDAADERSSVDLGGRRIIKKKKKKIKSRRQCAAK